jgi:hypothetical protein
VDRAKKVFRLNYWGKSNDDEPFLSLLSNPGEARLGVGNKSFISVKKDQISMSGGTPSTISIQGLSSSMKYAGMIQDLPFPLSILPTTPYNPFPKQILNPPMADLMDMILQVASLATSVLGA